MTKFNKGDFVKDQNNKIGIITKIKRQKSFDFATVKFPFGIRGVPDDFLRKVPKSKVSKTLKKILTK